MSVALGKWKIRPIHHRHIELVGHPDGVTIEKGVLSFKGAELFIGKA